MRKFIRFFIPPERWRIAVIVLMGMFTGLSIFIFYVSNAASYLSDESETCMNCHLMAPQYATWNHSAHRENATCNDCHVPQNNFFNKYYFKAKDGLRHATIFTLRREPQVIFIRDEGRDVVHQNCIRCHEYLLTDDRMMLRTMAFDQNRKERYCTDCHSHTPHGEVNSLSSVPYARVPVPSSIVPKWISKREK
ncbi:MAG: cytochrome c nitrite reductase small subunit [Bacteroidales bacterium]|nr:cytochrome c nitrite reductase small subunit [Bacteroidales bacterium]